MVIESNTRKYVSYILAAIYVILSTAVRILPSIDYQAMSSRRNIKGKKWKNKLIVKRPDFWKGVTSRKNAHLYNYHQVEISVLGDSPVKTFPSTICNQLSNTVIFYGSDLEHGLGGTLYFSISIIQEGLLHMLSSCQITKVSTYIMQDGAQ